jgi:hypothetical protein
MARKRLTKGANALRVEERIARVPADLGRPAEAETGIFEALRKLDQKDGPAEQRPARAAKAAGLARAPVASARAAAEHVAAERLGPGSFTQAERRAIVVSCTEYRNRLPTYLKSAKREVEIIDSILSKCAREERGVGRADGDGPKGG